MLLGISANLFCEMVVQPRNLLRNHGLRFVTSSVEKKEQAMKVEKEKLLAEEGQKEVKTELETQNHEAKETEQDEGGETKTTENRIISASAAYQIAASAASYLHSHTKSILHFNSSKSMQNENSTQESGSSNVDTINQDVASLMATTDSVTAVVAAKEEVKQAVADDLNSISSSPCEWFICDDDESAVRFFVIQVGHFLMRIVFYAYGGYNLVYSSSLNNFPQSVTGIRVTRFVAGKSTIRAHQV